jgi:hypothetical protein
MHSIIWFAAIGASLLLVVVYGAPQYTACSSVSWNTISISTSRSSSSSTSVPSINDGFPPPNNNQLLKIEERAHGTLPNSSPLPPPPSTISPEGITNLQLVQFNENIEAAFFRSLLSNVTSNVPGFEIKDTE